MQYNIKRGGKMISGDKLKELRLLRGLTQKELAVKSELTDAAIRNYELGNRSPSMEQMGKIANALECDISALIDHNPVSIFEIFQMNNSSQLLPVFQIIFDYEELLNLRPLIEEGTQALMSQDVNFNDFLVEWDEMRKKHYNEDITDDEFRDWKLSYPKKSKFKK